MLRGKLFRLKGIIIFILCFSLILVLFGCGGIESIDLSESKLELAIGEEKTIDTVITPEDAEVTIEWSSNAPEIATVSDAGVIKGIAAGNAVITAKVGKVTAELEVEVKLIKYNVIFNTNEGSEIPIQSVQKGDKVSKPEDPTKDGFTFKGWYTAPNLAVEFDFNTPITANTTIYAGWEQVNVYIIFNTNGGSEIEDLEKPQGSELSQSDLAVEIKKVGHTFKGWYLDEDFTEEVDFGIVLENDLEIYAKWEVNSYTISFEPNNNIVMEDVVLIYGNLLVTTEPVKTGYVFAGWYFDEELTEAFDITKDFIANDSTLYGKWDLGESIVKFVTNGGSELSDVTLTTLDKLVKPTNPTRENYLFDNWYTDEELTQAYDFSTPVEGQITLYAKWKLDPAKAYTVEFELNGGEFSMSAMDFFINYGVEPINSFNDFAFNGSPWSDAINKNLYIQTTVASGGAYWNKIGLKKNDLGFYVVTEIAPGGAFNYGNFDYTISAWNQAGAAYTFASSLKLGDIITISGAEIKTAASGSVVTGATVKVYSEGSGFNEELKNLVLSDVELPTPYKSGATFDGWYTTASFIGDPVTSVSSNIKLYAKWN